MVADDPFGKNGPTIDQFLSSHQQNSNQFSKNHESHQSYHSNNYQGNQSKFDNLSKSNFSNQAQRQHFTSNSNLGHSSDTNNLWAASKTGSFSNVAQFQAYREPRFQSVSSNHHNGQNGSTAEFFSSKPRDLNETSKIYEELLKIFPLSDDRIKSLLSTFKNERNCLFFAQKLCDESEKT